MSVLPPNVPSQPPFFTPHVGLDSEGLLSADFSQSSAELPAYSVPEVSGSGATRQQTEHVISLTVSEKNTYQWLKLKVKSWAPSTKHLPSFVEGTPITGTVELDLPKPESIKAIVVSVNGKVVSSVIDERQFLELSETLWDSSMGDPRSPGQGQAQFTDKLSGQYSFPFTMSLPKKVNFTNKQHMKDLRLSGNEDLPPSLSGRSLGASINYELVVDIKRRGILKVGSTAKTIFAYTPVTRPETQSQLMQDAYRDRAPLLGPDVDVHGWEVFPSFEVEGTVFNTRKATLKCELAMAKPLSYTRGSFVPCYFHISCVDDQALDLASKPEALVLQMRRKVRTRLGVDESGGAMVLPGNEESNYLSKASWMLVGESSPQKRTLYGELALPSNLIPTFQFGKIDIKYVVDMFPFDVTGFVSENPNTKLHRSEVTVTSAYAPGIRPNPIHPPSYNPPSPGPGVEATRRAFRMDSFI